MKTRKYKIPVSSLIVIYTKKNDILLLSRADKKDYWQSVTGSLELEESPYEAARREVFEETGINPNQYAIQDWNLNHEYEIFHSLETSLPTQCLQKIRSIFLVWNFQERLISQ